MSLNYKKILNEIAKNNKDFHPISEEEKSLLQKCLYEMACDLDERCRKYGLKLFLVGGSLLGAIRHGGFSLSVFIFCYLTYFGKFPRMVFILLFF